MNKNTFSTVKLAKGEMNVYDFGEVRLHAYKTNDFLADEVFFFEKDNRAVALESPCFFDNYGEIEKYFAERGTVVEAMLIAYHMAGGTFLPSAKKYATKSALEYGTKGGGKALADGFTAAFGGLFDAAPHKIDEIVKEGRITVAGIDFDICPTEEAFDVVIPSLNAVYTHMLGHDCHSIVGGAAHADAMTAQLRGYLAKNYTLVLTSHYTPEDLKDVETKIAYLQNLKAIAAASKDSAEFKARVRAAYPEYAGGNYLDMTAASFFVR